jgi:tRNA(His) 5'-end guanylyltransferase
MFDSLGDRMKAYERSFDHAMPWRMPVVIRVDGRAFHTYTRGLERPFDRRLMLAMDGVALALCRDIQGARLAYVQSDEVSVLVNAYESLESQPWFGNRVQKTVSIAASIAAAEMTARSVDVFGEIRPAQFDARVFVLPEAEYVNYFLWRQQDWTRNSIQMLARSLYSHKECHEKDQGELQEMCWQKGQNWNDLPIQIRRGRCAVRRGEGERSHWAIDDEIPIWKNEGRAYVEQAFLSPATTLAERTTEAKP